MHILLLGILLSFFSHAQVIEAPIAGVNFEQNPSEIEWKKIDSEHFEVIFPEEISDEAQRVTFLLEKAYPFVAQTLEVKPAKISLILQNQSIQSNGFVTLAPRRSEWYVTPSIDPELGNTEWLKTLSIHEFRHVVQFQKTRQGFNRFLEILLGEVGQAAGLGLSLPPWYLEGDAVGVETVFTKGGRGRLPLFDRDLRTLLLSGKDFNYDKSHMGSYKDYIPSHYVYGYFLTSYLREKKDIFLSELADKSSSRSYNPLTFYDSYNALTGENFDVFYSSVMKDLVKEWSKRLDQVELTPFKVTSAYKKHGWTNYLYPQEISPGKVLSLKYGLSHIKQFVVIESGKEKTLFYPGPLTNEYPYKVRNQRMAYLEKEFDPRWGYRDFGRLKIYDFKKDKIILDIRKTKWRLGVLDHKGQRLLAIEWNPAQGQFIVVTNLKGKIIQRVPFPKEDVITSVDWLNDSEIVLVTKDRQDLKKIEKFNLQSRERISLLPPTVDNLGYISVVAGNILVEAPTSGIDNIYLVDNGAMKQITSSKFGAYAPALSKGQLLYNDYTADGMEFGLKELPWKEEQKSADSFFPVYEKFAKGESKDLLEKSYEEKADFKTKNYSQFKNAVNLHSWIFLAPPLSSTVSLLGVSRDVLNKFSLSAGASYNLNEQTTQGLVTFAWMHNYPVFDFRAAYGGRRQNFITSSGSTIDNKWEEGSVEAGVQLPWRNISGRFTQTFTIRTFAKVIRVLNKLSSDIAELSNSTLFSPGADVQFTALSRVARRDLYPEWGLSLSARIEEGSDITGSDQDGSIRSFDSRYYLPGLRLHHSFNHQLAYEVQNDTSYQYVSQVLYPRGTQSAFLDEFLKYSGNYSLPLFYPEWSFKRWLYVKQIFGNVFYDRLQGRLGNLSYVASSAGWELMNEMYFFRLALPVTIGLRGSYVFEGAEEKQNYEIFLSTLLGSF